MKKSPADRVKATRIRKLIDNDEATEDDVAWLETYEDQAIPGKNASASERVIHIEERAAAEGEHPHPDAYASMARAEGLRADTLLRVASQALTHCNEMYARMAEILLARLTTIENAHVGMLEAIRESHLARVDAEGEARMAAIADNMSGGDQEMAEMLKFAMSAWAANQGKQGASKAKSKKKKPSKSRPLGTVD